MQGEVIQLYKLRHLFLQVEIAPGNKIKHNMSV